MQLIFVLDYERSESSPVMIIDYDSKEKFIEDFNRILINTTKRYVLYKQHLLNHIQCRPLKNEKNYSLELLKWKKSKRYLEKDITPTFKFQNNMYTIFDHVKFKSTPKIIEVIEIKDLNKFVFTIEEWNKYKDYF